MPRLIKYDAFDHEQWEEALNDCDPLAGIVDRAFQENTQLTHEDKQGFGTAFHDLLADQFQMLKQPAPQYVDTKQLSLHEYLLREVSETQEFQHLKALAETDLANAAVGTSILGEKMLEALTAPVQAQLLREEEDPNAPFDQMALEGDVEAIRRSMRQAADNASAAIEEMNDAAAMFGSGSSDELTGTRTMTVQDKLKLAEKVGGSQKLKDLAAMAGRFQRIALAKRASVVREIPQEVVGVTLGNNVARALPSELMLAANPVTRPVFYKKLAESQLLQYDQQSTEQLGGGPIIILLDGSGSMRGARETWSKAIVMAYMAVAEKERRDVMICEFGGPNEQRFYKFPFRSAPNEVSKPEVITLVENFLDAGSTDFQNPLIWAAGQIASGSARWEKADIVMVTDGESRIEPEIRDAFNRHREATGFQTFAVMIGESKADGILKPVMDHLIHVHDLFGSTDATLSMLFGS